MQFQIYVIEKLLINRISLQKSFGFSSVNLILVMIFHLSWKHVILIFIKELKKNNMQVANYAFSRFHISPQLFKF